MADDTIFCRPCQRSFKTKTSLLQHRQTSGRHVHDCLRCDEQFTSASAVEQHRHNSRNHYICDRCDFDSSSQDGLEQHEIDVHNKCGTCGLRFASPSSLELHHRTVHIKREIESPGCSTPNNGASFDDEFSRRALSQKWVPGSRQYSQQRTIAMSMELTSRYFSSSKLKGYQDLCSEVDLPPGKSVTECVARLKSIYVNIVDLIDARRIGTKPKRWDDSDFEGFRDYTLKPGNIINRNEAKKNGGFLASLLHHLHKPRSRRRRGVKTNGFSSKVISGRVIKKSQN